VTLANNIVFATKDAAFHQHYGACGGCWQRSPLCGAVRARRAHRRAPRLRPSRAGTDNLITNNIWAFPSTLPCNESAGEDCDFSALRSSQHPVSQHDAGVNSSFSFVTNIVLLSANNTKVVRTITPTLGVANFTYANNLYWHIDGLPLRFGASGDDETFAQWQAMGKDISGRVADPMFKDARGLDFTLLPGSPALAMGFQPIDMSTVGVRDGPFVGM
jgi:hypothetical protein